MKKRMSNKMAFVKLNSYLMFVNWENKIVSRCPR